MKKRLTALFLALALVLALGVNAMSADGDAAEPAEAVAEEEAQEIVAEPAEAEAAEEEPETPAPTPDAEGTLSFANLGSRMLENYYPLKALQESIDDVESHDYEWRYESLRKQLNQIAQGQWGMVQAASMGMSMDNSAYSAMQSMYDQTREEFDAIKDGEKQKDDQDLLWSYHNAQNLVIVAGESLYMQIVSLRAQDTAATRGLAQLDRSLNELELRHQLGQVSALNVDQLKTQRAQIASQQQTLRTGIDAALLTLESMVGAELGEPLTLGALPKVTAEQLAAMDLEKDLEQAKEASYDLYDAAKQVEDFRKDYYRKVAYGPYSDKNFEVSQVKHAMEAMKYDYENTMLTYELNFRTLYAQVKDAAQVLETKKTALASQEKSYAVSALKYEQGSISANALAAAKDELATAKDDVSSAERELFSKYRSYQWAVEYGILNS